jgi:hypothetical protein
MKSATIIVFFIVAILCVVFLVQLAVKDSQSLRKVEETRNCKVKAHDTHQYIRKIGGYRWEVACIKAMPKGASLEAIEEQCSIKLPECEG